MRDTDLFQLALGLSSPWHVSCSEFNLDQKRLDIRIDFLRGSAFSCPECSLADLKAYDTVEKNTTYHGLDATDEVRRQEQKERPELAKTRYVWLKNRNNLKQSQIETLEKLQVKNLNLKTGRACHIKLNFQEFFTQPPEAAESFLENGISGQLTADFSLLKKLH